MAVSLSEYLTEIQKLTKKNLEILKALNNSFYTKSEHLSVTIDDTQYVIPSFLSLENKLNTLEDNFENLVNAPRTGEAAFDFNGNTQSIEMKGFTVTPPTAFEGLDMKDVANIKTFSSEKNSVFKDFLTPIPYVKIDLTHLPNDIHQVNVKKVALKNESLISLLKKTVNWQQGDGENIAPSVCEPINFADVKKKLYGYTQDIDYVMYDKVYTLPLRYELGTGKYVIETIENNWTDENFFEHYTLKLDNTNYKIADNTIERNVQIGDYFVTFNDKIKLLVEDINYSSRTVTVKVENGGFADLCTKNDGNVELSTLKFYAIGNLKENKYLNIPLEEDEYILVFLAPIQRNSLIQSAWSDGLMFHTSDLLNSSDLNQRYEEYYKNSVTNIGDKLFGLVSLAEKDFVNLSENEFNTLTKSKPTIDSEGLQVVLINKHMSNSETVQEIYNIYNQKEDYKKELNTVQNEINELNIELNKISFEDSTATRKTLTDQLDALAERKKELTSSIASCIRQLTIAATDTDTPVENPKYHIRGFFNYQQYLKDLGFLEDGKFKHNIIKIEVQYRYKNATRVTGNAETIGEDVFSDWNIMNSFINERNPLYGYRFVYPDDTSKVNEPSFNQIDIPISQGETVDIRMRVVYSIGYPFVKTASDWSEIVNIEFPVELRKNITVLDILKENNDDTTKEAFRGYLDKLGVLTHVTDNLIDQDITYYHKPEHIASGFYTEERRVIPLRDKLQSLTNDITLLKDEVYGTSSDNLLVTLSDGDSEIVLNSFCDNLFILKDYVSSDKNEGPDLYGSFGLIGSSGSIDFADVETTLTLNIQNNSKTSAMKLFAMYPGNYEKPLELTYRNSKFDLKDVFYYKGRNSAKNREEAITVPIFVEKLNIEQNAIPFTPQYQNQWISFRINDPYNGKEYFTNEDDKFASLAYLWGGANASGSIGLNDSEKIYPKGQLLSDNIYMFPYVTNSKDICITEQDSMNCKLLYPGESLQVKLHVRYKLSLSKPELEKTMVFDLRNSLYSDPINYKFTVRAKYANDLANNMRKIKKNRYTPVVMN